MNKYTDKEIEDLRSFLKGKKFPEVNVEIGNRSFSYFLLPQSMEPNFPDFVLRCTGDSKTNYLLGISDSVKEEFRKYAVAHEYIEFIESGIDDSDRCIKALDEELKLVPEEIKIDYMKMRHDFFNSLIKYSSNNPNYYTPDDLRQFRQNLSTLEELINNN